MSRFSTRTFRRATAAALTLATMAAIAPAADAARTSFVDRDVLPNIGSGRLSLVVDAPNGGVKNNVRVTRSGERYVVTDNADGARAQVASGCTEHLTGDPVTAARVECPVPDIVALGVFLRDDDDTVHNATDLPSFMMVHSGNDQAVGGSASDRIFGDTGNDVLSGEGGKDTIRGDEDDDVVDGGPGDDELDGGTGADILLGGPGTDRLVNSPGPDDFRGGQDGTASRAAEPVDVVAYTVGTVTVDPPIRVTLDNISNDGAAGEFDNVRDDVEKVVGANGPDHFTGNDLPNNFEGDDAGDLLEGRGGADQLNGAFGADELHGGEGPDLLRGGADADVLFGDGGDDVLVGDEFSGRAGDVLMGGTGGDTVSYAVRESAVQVDFDGVADDGGPGEQDRVGADVEHAVGGAGGDTLTGNEKFNHLRGEGGDDRIEGGLGADVLDGGAGNDTILARDGVADTVTCGDGIDTVDADPVDVLAADCERPAAPAPATPAQDGGAAPQDGGAPVLPGTGGVVAAAPSCPALRISTKKTTLLRGGVLRVRVAAARGGAPCVARVRVGTRVRQVRVLPGRTAAARFPLSRALRARVARERAGVRVTVQVRTVDPSGRVASARGKVRLLAR